MTDLKELFTSMNPTPSDVFKEDKRCYTCNNFITDLDRQIANGNTDQCTECFIEELIKLKKWLMRLWMNIIKF